MSTFSFISMNWRGRPLTFYRTIVELIGATTTGKGLRIRAERDEGYYPLCQPPVRRFAQTNQ